MLFNFILCIFLKKLNHPLTLYPLTLCQPGQSKGPCYFVTPDKMFDFLVNPCFTRGVQLAITIVLLLGEEKANKQVVQWWEAVIKTFLLMFFIMVLLL